MLSVTMNAAFPSSRLSAKSPGIPPVPPKAPSEASIGRVISSAQTLYEKSKSDVDNDCKSTYRDYSHLQAPSTRVPPSAVTFPMKLHQILSSPQFSHIISWLPHGRAWKVLDQKVFQEQVLPLFFKNGCYPTFCRQVNGWGFKRISDGRGAKSYYHELFLRGMPHLAEKMKRVTSKDARQSQQDERVPDLEAISRVKPLPRNPVQPPPTNSNNMDAFLSSLSDKEAHFLARRRSQMLERAAQVASVPRREIPTLPTNGRDMDAYLASLTDAEALVLARRREQELRELSSTLRVLRQARQAPRGPPVLPAPSSTRVAFQNEHGAGTSTTTLTGEEKLLLATHRARRLAASSSDERPGSSPQRSQRSRRGHGTITARQFQQGGAISSNSAMGGNPLLAALFARPMQNVSTTSSQSSGGAPQENPLVAALLARRVSNTHQASDSQVPQVKDSRCLLPARQPQTIGSSLVVNSVTANSVDPFAQASARGAKVQADFLASAIQNDAHRLSTETTSTLSQDSETAIMSRARQAQAQREFLDSPNRRRDSNTVVREALEVKRRADTLHPPHQQEKHSHPMSPTRDTPVAVVPSSNTIRERSQAQTNATVNETRKSIAEIRASLLDGSNDASSVLDVAKFLVMNKEGRS